MNLIRKQHQQQEDETSSAFRADAFLVRLVAEAYRIRHAYLFNPLFATETSLIDPLPHQFIAVYDHLLTHFPLRFLLADDAGAGKTIMTGLYLQELLLRRQVERVLIVPPAGLVGNWERELRVFFRLQFRILSSTDTNPFLDSRNRLAIVSLDTLRQEQMQDYLFQAPPYDLVVFDEAHKLSARFNPDGTIYKSKRYELAERIAAQGKSLLLLTATPHMGKDDAYYLLWRLLEPDLLASQKAFYRLSDADKSKHLLRRMKEEMITFDEKLIYPPRLSRTIAYPLKTGQISELELYDRVTAYCERYYDLAQQYNQTAAKLAMMVLQRRLASSTYALLRSLSRRKEKLAQTLNELREGRLSQEALRARQSTYVATDVRDEKTGDEEEVIEGQEEAAYQDEQLSGATATTSIADVEVELSHVQELLALAGAVYDQRSESKFEKLWEALQDYPETKVLIFTEHRDTLDFVVARLEALGFTGRVAQIHGGMNYTEREAQVAFFRDLDGAQYLVATDAAGEGINLQFCWLMVNYDIPWNPARIEQRMGRIHRYKQKHTVVLLNLVAEGTREGRVLKVLLDKLERISEELGQDKVFDVIGQQFSGVSLAQLIAQAIVENKAEASIHELNSQLTAEKIQEQLKKQQEQVASSEVRRLLEGVRQRLANAELLRMMPAYVRSFFEEAAPLVGYGIEGDIEGVFRLSPCPAFVQHELEKHPAPLRDRLTFSREIAAPADFSQPQAVLLHPGEPVFDTLLTRFLAERGDEGGRGAVYFDADADQPYLFYLARIPVIRQQNGATEVLDEKLVGVKQLASGQCLEAPAHLLLTLSVPQSAVYAVPSELARLERETACVEAFVRENFGQPALTHICDDLRAQLPEKKKRLQVAFNLRKSDLLAQRLKLKEAVAKAVPAAQTKLNACERELHELDAKRAASEAALEAELQNTQLGPVTCYVRALVLPAQPIASDTAKSNVDAEAIAVQAAIAHEQSFGATVTDVSNPALKRGFDIESHRPNGEVRYIEVKGRTGVASVELTANEWRQAANHPSRYWLYVVFHCDANPHLYRCRDPFGALIAKAKGSVVITASDIIAVSD